MTKPAFLFDLDMTLLDTSALKQYRDRRQWDIISEKLQLAKPFEGLGIYPHEVPTQLKAKGYQVGIVTSSPRRYANVLLQKYNIQYDTLVTYDDTEDHKPHPAPLEYALSNLARQPQDVYHIGDETKDVEASYHAGITSIGAGWGMSDCGDVRRTAPDIIIHDPLVLFDAAQIPRLGYLAELHSIGAKPKPHLGSVIHWQDEVEEKYVAFGRYFPTSDMRHASSSLSKNILRLKESDAPAGVFANALKDLIKEFKQDFSAIVCVPPKPGQRNRFEAIFKLLKGVVAPNVQLVPDGLQTVKNIPNYKSLGMYDRAEEIRGAFASAYTWQGKVWLIDDVYTSGATTDECIRVLKSNGANTVVTLVFALDQYTIETKMCPACGRQMKVRTNGRDGSKFWGCTGYHSGVCKHTENIPS